MPNWSGGILTTRGKNLQAKVDAGQTTLTFTKMKIGSGILPNGQSLESLTELITPKQNIPISGIAVNGNITTLTAVITNAGVTAGYQVRELGIYATDPTLGEILYSVTVDSAPDYLPPEGGAVAVSQEFNYHIAVSNAANVSATLSTSGLVTVGMLKAHNHDGTGSNGPKLGSSALLEGAVTDLAIGNRIITDTVTAAAGADTPTNLWNKLGNMVKQITGKVNWWTPPAITLEALNSLIATTAAAGKLLKLDSNGLLPTGITGNAATATKWQTPRTLTLTGDVTGSTTFDGTGNASIAATVMAGMPLGFTFSILANTPPDGCLALQGALVSRTAYPELWAWVQANAPLITESAWQAQAAVQSSVGTYSSGDGSTTFRLPLITDFIRGSAAGRDPGTWQSDEFKEHNHLYRNGSTIELLLISGGSRSHISSGSGSTFNATGTDSTGGAETRPKSVSMLWCVKAFGAAVNQGTVDITALAAALNDKIGKTDIGYGTQLWVSSEYTPVANTPTIVNHGIVGLNPLHARGEVLLKCVVAEHGYSVGDYMINPGTHLVATDQGVLRPALSATTIQVNPGQYGTGLVCAHKSTINAGVSPTLSNWRFIFRIWH